MSRPTSSRSLCLPPARMHFWVSAARRRACRGTSAWPRKMGTNWFMPALVNSRFGESGIRLDEGTMVCCFDLKKSRKDWRICLLVRISLLRHVLSQLQVAGRRPGGCAPSENLQPAAFNPQRFSENEGRRIDRSRGARPVEVSCFRLVAPERTRTTLSDVPGWIHTCAIRLLTRSARRSLAQSWAPAAEDDEPSPGWRP